jgi:hypothetical protein
VSGHEHERLSAWLDDELSADQRAEVDAHLAACAECRERLAELGAVDALARELPAEAPAGYFEELPSRLRARLESGRRPAALPPSSWRPPVWTWAAAAALILAVVTPLTLMRLGGDGTPMALEAPQPTTLGRGPASSEAGAPEQRDVATRKKDAPSLADDVEAPPLAEEITKREKGEGARERRRETTGSSETALEEALPAAPPPAPEPDRAQSARDVAEFAAAPLSEDEAPAAAPPRRPARSDIPRSNVARSEAARLDTRTDAETGEPADEARPAPGAVGAAPQALGPARQLGPGDERRTFARLDEESPGDAEGWRALREKWRAFAAAHEDSPLADEARVRTVETGLEAWRTGGDEEDLHLARDDARSYLARDDAAQAARVRRVLESVPDD